MITITIPGRLDGLNEYTQASRGNKYASANMKKRNQGICEACMLPYKKYHFDKLETSITWYEKSWNCRDLDNISFAQKFIFDALQSVGIIDDDGPKVIVATHNYIAVDKNNPRIEVTLKEVF